MVAIVIIRDAVRLVFTRQNQLTARHLPIAAKRWISSLDFSRSKFKIICTISTQIQIISRDHHIYLTYDADELSKRESEFDVDFHAHVFDRPDEFVVAPEEIANQPFLVLRARSFTSILQTSMKRYAPKSKADAMIKPK